MFKVGDRVRVVDNGKTYTTYKEFFDAYSVSKCNYIHGQQVGNGFTGDIVFIGNHLNYTDRKLAVIDSGYNRFIINIEGLELIEHTSKHHPHHDLIIAWAKGAEIEVRAHPSAKWLSTTEPRWYASFEYRIKPKPTARDKRIAKIESDMRKLADELKELHNE